MVRPYPAHWEADVVLRDGGTAHVRPIVPDDAQALRAFHRSQSEESIYLRFFAPYPELSDRDVERFTTVDHDDRVGLVATIGEDIVAVVRYDRTALTEAEVAFNIADAHQGRGLGSVLLEHIAAAARERGVHRFVAEVLPNNRKMISVFRDAGFNVESAYDDGIVHLSFDPELTGPALEVLQDREQRAEARSIERLLSPRSVAVIGASRVYDSVGQTVLRNLIDGGFPGEVHAVNPGATSVAGIAAYPSILAVPGPVDLAVVAVPASAVQEVVAQCARKGVQSLVVLSAGYAETGPVGRERQRALVAAARASGMRVIGPNSFGVVNTDAERPLNASLSPVMPPAGRIGFFSQSGALGLAILEAVSRRGLGLSSFVSAGNRADVSGNDLLQFWDQDQNTDVVLLYLESIGNPRKFSRLARRLATRKPVATIKAGRTTQGVPLGHAVQRSTVPAAAVDAMFAQAGVIRVDSLHELFDVGQLLATQPLPSGDRVVIIGNSDALLLLAADACAESGLSVIGEPIGLPASASGEDFRVALQAVFDDPAVDSVVTVFVPPLVSSHEEVAGVLAEAARSAEKTVVSTFLGVRGIPEQLRPPGSPEGEPAPSGSVPSYPTPEDAVRALAAATSYAAWRRRPRGRIPDLDVDTAGALRLARSLLATVDGAATEPAPADVDALLGCYGIQVMPRELAHDADEAVAAAQRLGYPVVLKAAAAHLRHRPDLRDVRLDLADDAAVRRAHASMTAGLGAAGAQVVVQPMAEQGVAVVLTSSEDSRFGPVVSFGLAGLATELLGDRAYRIPPLTDTDVSDMIRSVRAAPLLFGHLGADPADTDALEGLLLRVARLADDVPEIAELELNPVLVAERGLCVLHARVRLVRPGARADTGPRRLPGG